jgi:hypothetical protein
MDDFKELLYGFLAGNLAALDFEVAYLKLFKMNGSSAWTEDEYRILNDIFLDLDAFNPDQSSFDPEFDISENELKTRCSDALSSLKQLAG